MYCGIVLGSEPRQTQTAVCLEQLGVRLADAGPLDFLVLPMGCEELPEQMTELKSRGVCFGIHPGTAVKTHARERGIRLVDLNELPAFKRRNAVATAEAALALAVGNTKGTLFGAQVLVIGFGAIGSRLCRLLTALGAKVTGTARKSEDLVQIVLEGCRAVHTEALAQTARPYNVVFNTVPAPVLTQSLLDRLPGDCLILDLASDDGGRCLGAAHKNYIQALALPGKTAPLAAAQAAADTIWDKLEELYAGK